LSSRPARAAAPGNSLVQAGDLVDVSRNNGGRRSSWSTTMAASGNERPIIVHDRSPINKPIDATVRR
jgi:hypothetical protein